MGVIFCRFRKAIAKSGVQNQATQSSALAATKCETNQEISQTVDWTVSFIILWG